MVKYKFAKELLKMYDDVNEFEKLKERYLIIAKGKMPNDIPKVRIQEDEINICELLIKIGFAKSKSEAKRMIQGNGIKIDGVTVTDINKIINNKKDLVVQFGKNKFKKIIK